MCPLFSAFSVLRECSLTFSRYSFSRYSFDTQFSHNGCIVGLRKQIRFQSVLAVTQRVGEGRQPVETEAPHPSLTLRVPLDNGLLLSFSGEQPRFHHARNEN